MELWQIMAIVLGSLLFIVFLSFVIVYARSIKREREQTEQLAKMYSDPNLAKMDYDFTIGDDESERLVARAQSRNSQNISSSEADQQLTFLGAAETEGIEEITGNYKP